MAVLTHEERGVADRVEMYIVAVLPGWFFYGNRGFARQINTQDCDQMMFQCVHGLFRECLCGVVVCVIQRL